MAGHWAALKVKNLEQTTAEHSVGVRVAYLVWNLVDAMVVQTEKHLA